MPVTKRAAPDSNESSPKVAKASRTAKNGDGSKSTTKKSPAKASKQPPLSPRAFKSKALPLHVNLTHTPPTIQKEGEIDANGKEIQGNDVPSVAGEDIGFIGNLTLVPSSFSTGSYGWKGSKRITVELQSGEVDKGGEGREKVQVMLSINATVLGSKPEKKGKGKKSKADEEEEEEEEEADAAEELVDE